MHTSRVGGEESSWFTVAGLILEAAMDLDAVDVDQPSGLAKYSMILLETLA
jgi:hypothetical protein